MSGHRWPLKTVHFQKSSLISYGVQLYESIQKIAIEKFFCIEALEKLRQDIV